MQSNTDTPCPNCEALQRSNDAKDEALREIIDECERDCWSNAIDIARKALSHSSETSND